MKKIKEIFIKIFKTISQFVFRIFSFIGKFLM